MFATETATTAADIWAFAEKLLAVVACLGLGLVAVVLAGLIVILIILIFNLLC